MAVQKLLVMEQHDATVDEIDLDPDMYGQGIDSKLAISLRNLPQRWRMGNNARCQTATSSLT
jgi:hypothetical protein